MPKELPDNLHTILTLAGTFWNLSALRTEQQHRASLRIREFVHRSIRNYFASDEMMFSHKVKEVPFARRDMSQKYGVNKRGFQGFSAVGYIL